MKLRETWKVVLVSIVKNEGNYIEEWVIYHLSLGVEHIFVYDNGSDDDTPQKLSRFINGGLLTYIFWPKRGGQIDAYNHAVALIRDNAEWVGFLDADEFFVPHEHQDIYTFLSHTGADQVLIPWRNFPHSGHAVRPGGTTIESYLWAYRVAETQVVQVKHFVRVDQIEKVLPHFSLMKSNNIKVADGTMGRFTHAITNPSYGGAQINHYATRSQAENVSRLQKGQVSGSAHKRPDTFHPLTADVAARHHYDDSILRHFHRYVKEEALWRLASDQPHRFGLLQRARVLDSWNDVLFYFAKSYGNYALNEINIQAHTNFTFMRPESDGTSKDVGGFLLGYGKPVLLFAVEREGVSRYFQGSIHYADFVRRFSLRCIAIERNVRKEMVSLTISTPLVGGCFIMFDVDAEVATRLEVAPPNDSSLFVDFRAGRFAGAVYLPACTEGSLVVSVSGYTEIRELVVGYLP